MPTIARGNTAEIYCPLACGITFTPGSGGSVRVSVSTKSGDPSIPPQFIQEESAVSVTAASTLFAEAVGADATYSNVPFSTAQTAAFAAISSTAPTISYDGSSRVSAVSVLGGRSYTYTYPSSTQMVITASDGAVATITKDGSGRVTGWATNY